MDPAQGQEGPVADDGLAHGDALLAPAVDELDEGGDAVEGAAVVAAGHHGPRRVDGEQVPLGRVRCPGPRAPDRGGHDLGGGLAHDDGGPTLGSGAHRHRDRHAEVVGDELGEQAPGVLRPRVARRHHDRGVRQEEPRVRDARLAGDGPEGERGRGGRGIGAEPGGKPDEQDGRERGETVSHGGSSSFRLAYGCRISKGTSCRSVWLATASVTSRRTTYAPGA